MKNLVKKVSAYLGASRARKAFVRALAIVVVFTTTYSLVLPAITQTISLAAELDGVSVRVEAKEGAVPEGTELVLAPVLLPEDEEIGDDIRRLTEEETALIREAALAGDETREAAILKVLDISLYHNGGEIEPVDSVRLFMASELLGEAVCPAIVHLSDDGAAELLDAEIRDGESQILFGEDFDDEAELEIPDGMMLDEDGNLVPIPDGYELDEDGNLVPVPGELPPELDENGNPIVKDPELDENGTPVEKDPAEENESGEPSETPVEDEDKTETPKEPDESEEAEPEAPPAEEPEPEPEPEEPPAEEPAGPEDTSEEPDPAPEAEMVTDEFSVYAIVDLLPRQEEPEEEEMTFEGSVEDMDVFVTAPAAAFPEGTTMELAMVPVEEVEAAVNEAVEGEVKVVKAVDITFYSADGEEIEPSEPISVVMRPHEELAELANAENDAQLVHIGKEEATVVAGADVKADEVSFASGEFSTYVIVIPLGKPGTQTYEGGGVTITVSYGPEANLPEGTVLEVEELEEGSEAYSEYLAKTQSVLNLDASVVSMEDVSLEAQLAALLGGEQKIEKARFFDITLVYNGEEVEPEAPVTVEIKYDDASEAGEGLQIVHFAEQADGTEKPEIITPAVEDGTVTYQQESFSVDAVTLANAFGNAGWVKDGRMEFHYGRTKIDNKPVFELAYFDGNVLRPGYVPTNKWLYYGDTGYPAGDRGVLHPGTTIENIVEALKKNPDAWQLNGVTIDFIMHTTYDVNNESHKVHGRPGGATEIWDASGGLGGVKITRGSGFDGYLIDMYQNTPAMQMKGNVIVDNAAMLIGNRSGFDDSGAVSQPVAIRIRDGGLLMMINGSHITDSTASGSNLGTGVLLTSTIVSEGSAFNPSTQGGNIEIFNLEGRPGGTSSYIAGMAVAIEQEYGETRLKTAADPFRGNTVGVALHHGNFIEKWEDQVPSTLRVPVFLRDVEKWKSGDIVMNSGYTPPKVHKSVVPADEAKLTFVNGHNTTTQMGLEYYAGSGEGVYPIIRFYVGTVLNTRTEEWYKTLYDAVNGTNPIKISTQPRPEVAIKDDDTLVFYGNTLEGLDININHNLTIRSSNSSDLPTDDRSGSACTAMLDHSTITIAPGKTVTFAGGTGGLTLAGSSGDTIENNGTLNLQAGVTLCDAKGAAVRQNGEFHLYEGVTFRGNAVDTRLEADNRYITLETTHPATSVRVELANQYNGRDVVVAGTADSIGTTLDESYLDRFPLTNMEETFQYVYNETGGPGDVRVLELKENGSGFVDVLVLDEDDQPVAGVEVAIDGTHYTTGEDGHTEKVKYQKQSENNTVNLETLPVGYEDSKDNRGETVYNVVPADNGEDFVVNVTTKEHDEDVISDNIHTFVYKLASKKHPLTLLKTDAQGNALGGAEFTFTGAADSSPTLTSKADGQIWTGTLKAGVYTLTETKAPESYKKPTEPIKITIAADGSVTTDAEKKDVKVDNEKHTVTVINFPATVKVTLIKVETGKPDKKLEGAVFQLSAPGWAKQEKTGVDGQIVWGDVPVDKEYTLTEIEAPKGYLAAAEPVTITIKDTGEIVCSSTSVEAQKEADGSITITVTNSPGQRLPNTGGIGTLLFTAVGASLMGAAFLLLALRKKGRGRA